MRKTLAILLACVLSTLVSGTFIAGSADADAGHVVTIDDVSVAEGSGGVTGLATVTLHVTPAPVAGERVLVDYGTSASGATARSTAAGDATPEFPEDFAQTDGTLTFNALDAEESLVVPILGDNADESNETFFINVFNPRGECVVPGACVTSATVGDPRATVTITDDDATPTLALADVEHDEGNADTTSYTFAVTKTGGNGNNITVKYDTADGSAIAPSDYAAKTGTLTFPASNSLLPVTDEIVVAANGDTVFEPTEAFEVVLSNAANATIADARAVGTITNDDATPLPTMTVGDASATEGEVLDYTVSLSNPPGPGQTATVDWALVQTTGDGSATEGTDYAAASGSVVYTAGENTQTISALTIEDVSDEADETFNLKLTKPATAGTGGYTYNLSDDTASGTIVDDDGATFTIDDVSVTEGNSGTTSANFTVTKAGSTGQTATVAFATTNGTAKSGFDYTATSGTLSFGALEASKTIAVPIKGDLLDEINETFVVTLSGPTNASITDGSAAGTITDNDAAPRITTGNDSEYETANKACTLLVKLDAPSGRAITFHYATLSGTAGTRDYVAKSGNITFVAGDAAVQVKILVRGDSKDESTEKFSVKLSGISPAGSASFADATGTCSIIDND